MRIIHCLSIAFLCAVLQVPCQAADTFAPYWTNFKAAVSKRDKEAVASMTKMPFFDGSEQLNKKQFLAKFDQIFPKGTAKCLSGQKPVPDKNSYSAFCGETIYVFSKEKGKYLFSDLAVND